jgi:hypothetical protein
VNNFREPDQIFGIGSARRLRRSHDIAKRSTDEVNQVNAQPAEKDAVRVNNAIIRVYNYQARRERVTQHTFHTVFDSLFCGNLATSRSQFLSSFDHMIDSQLFARRINANRE